ncbi:hypothetical protein L484_015799 [Morus notabilis]|uniref:Uncharacterized protein n=1 Tax=Morus notabilis TaxID=981085 RepID=W9QD43_9ROSA|nr:hypothetical protein L484_015799 [Morus notabilis]
MAVYKSRRGLRHSPAVMMAAMMLVAAVILINANCGGAVVLVRSNVTYGCNSGREGGGLIAEDLELEWLMEYSSHVARVLGAAGQKPPTNGAEKGNNVPCYDGKDGEMEREKMERKRINFFKFCFGLKMKSKEERNRERCLYTPRNIAKSSLAIKMFIEDPTVGSHSHYFFTH